MIVIDKDTSLYCSFAEVAGSKGCAFHNAMFHRYGINAIYKSFSVKDISAAINAMRTLNIKGAGVTMPFKQDVLKFVDTMSESVSLIGASNTIINNNGKLHAENTDFLAVRDYLSELRVNDITILGNGGFSKAVQYACKCLGMKTYIITRENWSDIYDLPTDTVFNCTPVENIGTVDLPTSINFIDCIVTTETGKELALRQAKYQFKLYTGIHIDYE
jgi:shikimate 5-dehydrogenase